MLRLQGNQLNKWIKQKAKGSEVPACTAAPTGRCLLWAELSWWVSARHSVLPQVNCPGKAGVSLSLCKCVCVWQRKQAYTNMHVYAHFSTPPPTRRALGTCGNLCDTWSQASLTSFVCAASLIGHSPLHCQCVFYLWRGFWLPQSAFSLFLDLISCGRGIFVFCLCVCVHKVCKERTIEDKVWEEKDKCG